MLAHQEQIDTGNNLLKIADGQAMMSAESYESELAYQQNVHEQSHYYQHHGFEQQQQQQHYNSNGHPNDHAPHNLHPHHQQHHPQQLSHPQEYYHQQQLMYNQGMSNYNYPSDQVLKSHSSFTQTKTQLLMFCFPSITISSILNQMLHMDLFNKDPIHFNPVRMSL